MSTFMERISNIIKLGCSSKILEHKKSIKYLLELCEDSEGDLQQITDYSSYLLQSGNKKKEGYYSWNDIFIIIHNLFESEITRISKLSGPNSGKLDKERITKLLFTTSDKACFYLKPKTVINSTLSILQYDKVLIFSEYYEVYLNILRKYVLQERSQRVLIPQAQWKELLEVCTTILKRKIQNLDYVKLLETVELIVKHGCSLSNLLFDAKKLLPIIGDLFENYSSYNIRSTDILFKLGFTVCQQIATDSRYILCVFSENLPISMIEFKGSEEKYELYLLFIQAHHPNGAILGDYASHVYDEEKWKVILHFLYKMVLKDIKLTTLSKNHLALACEVFRQKMFTKIPQNLTQSSMFQESAYIQPRKKRRISDVQNEERVIDLVNDRDPERAWPIIQIATQLYKKYPDCLKLDESIEFLEAIAKLMSQSKVFSITESLCELATVIAQIDDLHKEDDLKRYWDKIWDAALRYISMSYKDVVEKGCFLVQTLIYCKRISSPDTILKLFTTQSIEKSYHSIHTLEVFCQNNLLPSSDVNSGQILTNNSVKLQLMNWTLHPFPKRLTSSSSIQNFSKLLIGLTLKTWYKKEKQTLQIDCRDEYCINMEDNFYENMQSMNIDRIEQCYLSLDLKTNIPFATSENKPVQIADETNLDNPYSPEDLDSLLNNLLQVVQTDGAEQELNTFITKTALIAAVLTDLKAMSMIQSAFHEFCLVTELKTCLSKIMNELKTFNWSKFSKRGKYALEITRALVLLYQTKYDASVNDIIISSTTYDAVKKLYDIKQLDNSESTRLQECKVNLMITLALFSCKNNGEEILDFQVQIASTLLKFKKYSFSDRTDVISALTILKIFSNFPNRMITDELLELLMDFILELFQKWHRDDRVNRCLLQLLPRYLDMFASSGSQEHVHNLFLICKHYHDKFAKEEFGQLTHLSLVECLSNIINHNSFAYSAENEILNDDVFITFVKSSYYLVRLKSLKLIHTIFSSKKLDYLWKDSFFNKLKDAVNNIFVIERELTPEEIQEERLIRSISVMQILTTVICSQSLFQSSALFALSQVIVEKGIETGIVQKALQAIDDCGMSYRKIIEDNLNYILTNWCSDRSLESFPLVLLNCSSASEFHDRYAHVIFPVLIRGGKIEESVNLCYNLHATFQQLFKVCSANIIPWALSGECPGVLGQMQDNDAHFSEIGNFSTLLHENLLQIIVEIVQRLHDVNDFHATFNTTISLPERDPPHYKCNVVDQCFDRLEQIILGECRRTVFHYIMTRHPSTAQRLLLQLTRNVYTSSITECKAVALHQYVYFCGKIVGDLKESYCDIVASYFVKDIVSTLLHLAKADDAFIAELACKYLHIFLNDLLPERSAQIGQILNFCVKTLTPLIRRPNEISPAKTVLVFLLKDQRECLAEAIDNLACLPNFMQSNDQERSHLKTINDDLRHFLKASDDHNCSIDSLLKLKQQLTAKKSELGKLYEELESSQGFAEDCVSSLLHNLIYRLIQLTKSKDTKIALEAAKCLGVLGPANLSTMILHPQETPKKEADKVEMLTYKLCQILADLVVSPDIEIRTVSSDALYVLSEYDCREYSETLQDFLYPFKSAHKIKISRKKIKLDTDIGEANKAFSFGRWTEESKNPYNTWIADLTSDVAKIIIGLYSESLIPLFKLNVHSCEVALPRLISIIIETDLSLVGSIIRCINDFFHYHFGFNLRENETPSSLFQKMQDSTARDAVWCILNVVNHLRIQTDEQIKLDFDYLSIAMAAQFCSAYFSSILYAELWCRSRLKNSRDFDSIPMIEQIYEQLNLEGKTAQEVLREAYIKIGDTDSIHGCGSSHLQNRTSKISYYTNFQKLDKLMLSHDIACNVSKISERGLITALKDSSLYYIANRLLSTSTPSADPMEDLSYDCFWRLSDWNQISNFKPSSSKNEAGNFSTTHYEALQCLHDSNKSSLGLSIEKAHFCVIKELSNISLESCEAVYPKLTKLQMLREIEELNATHPSDYNVLIEQWSKDKYFCNNNFQYVEPILTQRTVMFKINKTMDKRDSILHAFIDTQYQIAQLAEQEGNFNVAARALEIVSKEKDLDLLDECYLKYHEAQLALMRKDEDMARYNLRSVMKCEYTEPSLLAQVFLMYGNWIAENKSENPQAIISQYFEKALSSYSSIEQLTEEDLKNQCKAYAALAQFSHEQYLVISDYMNSSTFESLQECIDYSRNINNNKPSVKNDKDLERAVYITDKQSRIDSKEVENIKKDKAMYLSFALKNYLKTLQNSDDHDFLIFRLVSLWLSSNNMYDEEVNRILNGRIDLVPSYKFIPLVPQLAPHISDVQDSFTSTITEVLRRCALDHPHHTLPVLLALKNLHGDSKYCNKKNNKVEARVLGAQQLVKELLGTNIKLIVQEMDRLSDALVMLAYYDAERKKAGVPKCSIPRNCPITGIKDFKHSVVPTITLDISKTKNYRHIVSIRKYETSYENVGGINAPKKIICFGTDGTERPQLVKGRDDLRQDAVMQQVFTVMNSLLKCNKDAKQRKLHVRTYRVVPLTQRSGVLEWCSNTLPLSSILSGDGKRSPGLHVKYFPQNYSPLDCRKKLAAAKGGQVHNVFMECCKNLPPAFHYFFTENYLSPEIWFERRMAYTRSVATTSIIGYILGLGDRHVSNILIDISTAEVVHIDFGIAFEQGKVLPTPETVPFRLTRDIEAGMGVSGVEGTMRRSCEETMTVLREQKEIIVTLLRVLLYDPLYSWAITPAKAATYQSENSARSSESKESSSPGVAETNKMAERALLRVQQKLQGIEEGVSSSIPGQVTRLIQQARDPANLCRLFAGWQAYL